MLLGFKVVHQQVFVLAKGAHELLHRLKAAAHRSGAPFPQIPVGPARAVVVPEAVKGFFDKIGSRCFEIVLQHFGELLRLLWGEIGRSFQKAIARAFEDGFVSFFTESFGFIATNLVDGFIELFDDMKAVKDVEGLGEHLRDDIEVGLPHVGADDFDLAAIFGAEFFEESSQGVFFAFFDHSEKSFAS